MSGHHNQEYHHQQQQEEDNVFTFPANNGFERSVGGLTGQQQQIRRENKISSLMAIQTNPAPHEDPSVTVTPAAYETTGMLSEMFNFGPGTATEILDYRRAMGGLGSDWYGQGGGGSRQVARDSLGDHPHQHQPQHNDPSPPPQIPSINAGSAASMQLFLTNPPPRSPSPPPPAPPPTASGSASTLHMLLPSPVPNQLQPPAGFLHPTGVHPSSTPSNPNFWGSAHISNPAELGGIIEGQGLSLSLSSSLQQLEAAKQVEEFRNIGGGDHSHGLFFNQNQAGVGASSSPNTSSPRHHFIKGMPAQPPMLHNLQGLGAFGAAGPGPSSPIQTQVHLGFGSPSTSSNLGMVNVLRSSKYAKPAQELLEEFCSVGRGQLKKLARQNSSNQKPNPNPNPNSSEGGSSSSKDPPPPLSPADRIEHQRRKVKLLAMLDEVDRRYNHYCEQMQMVVNSFDMVMGYGAAIPYTALAQKAMSRHFRCLKEAIQAQLRQSCELLGEKDPTGSSGLTKGETPRLKMLEQSLRQQRAFHQMGMMDQEAWRPQRGLPERSVNILRAWLFEHFLHPYPSDADKHLLARQTGLSRNQVSNWFINARVRLWKPMIEEMYQEEAKDSGDDDDEDDEERERNQTSSSTGNTHDNANLITPTHHHQQQQQEAQNPMPSSSPSPVSATLNNNNNNAAIASASAPATEAKRSAETMTRSAPPHDHHTHSSHLLISTHHHHHNHQYHHHQPPLTATAIPPPAVSTHSHPAFQAATDYDDVGSATMIRFGTAATTGDVSLTLGLRHAGNNAPDKTAAAFSLRDFGS